MYIEFWGVNLRIAAQQVLAISCKEWGMESTEGRCSHGKTWKDYCPACELIRAHETVRRWGREVDEARKALAEAVVGVPDSEGGEV
ncbi:hypothetical protein KTD31_17065 [Burkholderia multivorans]|uniref:hypothetical protein n=1 Tax=Burkholderia multivorans TaxID=87883 RepID=UPI000A672436|nr:hypothetical protein [Burkholderia multivorans]MBU9203070.1 hypothetical protein [Burkholderia multivorans]MCA8385308.1 hypothetical protein [Burkholderia multivorans]